MRRRRFVTGLLGTATGAGLVAAQAGHATAAPEALAWQEVPAPGGEPAAQLHAVAAAGQDLAWAVGEEGRNGGPPGKPPSVVLRHYDGQAWTNPATPFAVGPLGAMAADADGRPAVIAGWDFWDGGSAHYLRWNGAEWLSERGPTAPEGVTPVMSAVTAVPGTPTLWSAGTTATSPYPPAQLRLERYA